MATMPPSAGSTSAGCMPLSGRKNRPVLRAQPPLASTLDPARWVIEHGVVVDSDGDRVADCRIGISTDAPTPGDFRVWVTDLTTGDTAEQVGGPYGVPIDFSHPAEGEDPAPSGHGIAPSPCSSWAAAARRTVG